MSGGSLDYAYGRVDDIADQIDGRADTPLHRAFAAHLRLVSKALHDLEWMWSGDIGDGDEVEAIRACLPADAELKAAIADAERAKAELEKAIEGALGEVEK